MNDFTKLFLKLDQTNKTNDKIEALEKFLLQATPQDRLWMIALFTGRQPKRAITSRFLKDFVIEQTKLPIWLFEETYHVIGDLAETLAILLPHHETTVHYTLSEWMTCILQLDQQLPAEKKQIILKIWSELNLFERLVFNKILTGSFRLGVSQQLIVRALANVYKIDANVIAHRLMGNWSPLESAFDFFLINHEEDGHLSRPYPFCLAFPLDVDIETLGSIADWFVEWKWDGIRGQIVKRQDMITLWSRGEEMVNDRFPELTHLQSLLKEDCVLDGEIVAYKDESVLPFQLLQQRIGRKKITAAILKDIPVQFIAYDLLEWNGKDFRAESFEKRRAMLQTLISQLPSQELIRLSPQILATEWTDLHAQREQSRAMQAEGLMLKKKDSLYHVGRKRGDWWKWKINSLTIDAVLIYAQKGHGWRANVFSDYTFAVWDQDQLIPFAKAYSGLTKKELNEVDRFIKANTLEKFGPVRSVKAELVFEIAFEGIQLSKRHKSGVAVRFPRILRRREDKQAKDADTIETLKALIDQPTQNNR